MQGPYPCTVCAGQPTSSGRTCGCGKGVSPEKRRFHCIGIPAFSAQVLQPHLPFHKEGLSLLVRQVNNHSQSFLRSEPPSAFSNTGPIGDRRLIGGDLMGPTSELALANFTACPVSGYSVKLTGADLDNADQPGARDCYPMHWQKHVRGIDETRQNWAWRNLFIRLGEDAPQNIARNPLRLLRASGGTTSGWS